MYFHNLPLKISLMLRMLGLNKIHLVVTFLIHQYFDLNYKIIIKQIVIYF